MKSLTVFTSTYNRANCLNVLYESLKSQTSKDFLWIIVDDGSTDNTKEVVEEWQKNDNGFSIKYIYKENGGMYTGYNTAIEQLDTPLAVCIDSDDSMPNDAVERIVSFWNKYGEEKYAGIIGLDFDKNGKCLGDYLPDKKSISAVKLLLGDYKVKTGDLKYVVRSELYKEHAPMPVFDGERDYNPQTLNVEIGKTREYLVLNENICIVDYQSDGMSSEIFKQYLRSPKSYMAMRILNLKLEGSSFFYKFKNCIHYVAEAVFCRDKDFIKKSPRKTLTVLAIPFGFLFTFYIKYRVKHG